MNNTNVIELNVSEKKNLLDLIKEQNVVKLRALPLVNYNLNFVIDDESVKFDQQITPLLAACYIGKTEIVCMLLENETIDVDMQSHPQEFTPLMVSCYKGLYEITRNLLEKHANVNKVNLMGHKAMLFCFSRLEESNYKYENKKICMMLIDLLLNKGAEINLRVDENFGHTILMKLVSIDMNSQDKYQSTAEMIQFLIERGADINTQGYDG
jgi:ankyrin repeat protein